MVTSPPPSRNPARLVVLLLLTGMLVTIGAGIYGIKTFLRPLLLPEECQAVLRLATMLDEHADPQVLTYEWLKTDPANPAPNSLSYDREAHTLTLKTPSETVVYGRVKPQDIKHLAARIQADEEPRVAEVTKQGATIISRQKNTNKSSVVPKATFELPVDEVR